MADVTGPLDPTGPLGPVFDHVLDQLGRGHGELVDLTCARIYGELSSYAHIGEQTLGAAVGQNLHIALTALREFRSPAPGELREAAQRARERYFADVPVEEIIRSFRISIALIHERFVDLAISQRLPAEQSVAGARVLWGLADSFTTRIITEYHDLELDTAFQDAQRRITSVRRLLAGETSRTTGRHALEPNASYAALRCEVPEGANAEQMRRRLQESGSAPGAAAVVVTDGSSCFGIVAQHPGDPGAPVGLGPFGAPAELPVSDRAAKDALHLARRLGRPGIQSIETLGWRLAVASRPDVWQHYANRFLVPVTAEGGFGTEILAAVRAWMDTGQSIPRAAQHLVVHPNTVRYRLRRFEELTGADLSDLDDFIGTRCAIELGHPDDPSV